MIALSGGGHSQPLAQAGSVNYIERVVAAPGDEIRIRAGHLDRNLASGHDPSIGARRPRPERGFLTPVEVPPGHWFMMGGNRGDSDDSRYRGPLPTGWISGDAFATHWPVERIGSL